MSGVEYTQFILNLVSENPGKYSPDDLIREVRMHGIDSGQGDPGLVTARGYVEEAIMTGKINVHDKVLALGYSFGKRCYPK